VHLLHTAPFAGGSCKETYFFSVFFFFFFSLVSFFSRTGSAFFFLGLDLSSFFFSAFFCLAMVAFSRVAFIV